MFKPSRFYSLILGFVAIVSASATIWIVSKLDPMLSTQNVAYFYLSIGSLMLSTTALILFFFRQRFGVREMVQKHFIISLRQGSWVAILSVTALILQSYNLFSWYNSVFLIISLAFLEVYFLYSERKSNHNVTNIT